MDDADKPKLTVVPPAPEGTIDPPPKKVVRLDVVTTLDLDPNVILREAIEADLESVIVVGYRKNTVPESQNAGGEYFASSIAAGDTCVWLLHRSILKLLRYADTLDDEDEPPKGRVG